MAIFRNVEVVLGQTPSSFMQNSVILGSVICLKAIYVITVKIDITVLDWYDIGIFLKPQFHVMVYLSNVFCISETQMWWPKNTLGYIGL
jgi:hypothetical protein